MYVYDMLHYFYLLFIISDYFYFLGSVPPPHGSLLLFNMPLDIKDLFT